MQTLSRPKSLLVANRGEIAIRILRTAAGLGMRTVAVFSEDDARCLHVRKADEARPLQGSGAAAYLDAEQILAVAREAACDAIHPGYGFLAENAGFARRCAEEGIRFVGPRAELLELLGDKGRARALAERCGVPILPGTSRPTTVAEAREFLASLGAGATIVLKAIAGGGGRGMRMVSDPATLEDAYERCRSEAQAAFGNGDLYVERYLLAGAARRSADRRRRIRERSVTSGRETAPCSAATRSSSRSRRARGSATPCASG